MRITQKCNLTWFIGEKPLKKGTYLVTVLNKQRQRKTLIARWTGSRFEGIHGTPIAWTTLPHHYDGKIVASSATDQWQEQSGFNEIYRNSQPRKRGDAPR